MAEESGGIDLDDLPDLAVLVDMATMVITQVNARVVEQLGYAADDVVGRSVTDFGVAGHQLLDRGLISDIRTGKLVHFDRLIEAANGTRHNVSFAARRAESDRSQVIAVGRDVAALAHADSRLSDLLTLADLTDDLFVVSDELGFSTYANDAAHRFHGESAIIGSHVTDFLHEDDTGWAALMEQVAAGHQTLEGRVLTRRWDGVAVTLEVRSQFDEVSRRWFTIERDVSAIVESELTMARLAADLHRQANTDSLTGVANRAALGDALDRLIEARQPFGLLLLDMDDFKSVNDTMGHAAGDSFLQRIAQRLVHTVKEEDVVARLGGDEFVVVLRNVNVDDAAGVAGRVVEAVSAPYEIAGTRLQRSCSIGVAVARPDDDRSSLLRRADNAAYTAKHAGRSRYVVYGGSSADDTVGAGRPGRGGTAPESR